jgi:hypothetical protein
MDFINCGSGYYVKEKINKHTIFVLFQKEYIKKHERLEWYVVLWVYRKRKKADSMMFNKETTFENGILNLLFAKKAIIEFIDFIKKERFSRYNSWIIIQATDERRFNVYKRGVKGLNFITEFHNGAKSLIWKEEKNE